MTFCKHYQLSLLCHGVNRDTDNWLRHSDGKINVAANFTITQNFLPIIQLYRYVLISTRGSSRSCTKFTYRLSQTECLGLVVTSPPLEDDDISRMSSLSLFNYPGVGNLFSSQFLYCLFLSLGLGWAPGEGSETSLTFLIIKCRQERCLFHCR